MCLPCASAVPPKHRLSPKRRSGRSGGIPTVPAMPPRDGAIFPCLEGDFDHRGTRRPYDRRRRGIGWRTSLRRNTRGTAGHVRTAPDPAIRSSLGSHTIRGGEDATRSTGQASARRNRFADDQDRNPGGLWEPTALQRRVRAGLPMRSQRHQATAADRVSTIQPTSRSTSVFTGSTWPSHTAFTV